MCLERRDEGVVAIQCNGASSSGGRENEGMGDGRKALTHGPKGQGPRRAATGGRARRAFSSSVSSRINVVLIYMNVVLLCSLVKCV